MDEGERLGFLINHLKTNAFKFSQRARISQGSVSNIVNGKRRMSRDIIDQIAEVYPEVNIEWLLRGIGSPFHAKPETEFTGKAEKAGDYHAIKSPDIIQDDNLPDEDKMKNTIAVNLRTVGKRWKLTQIEMLELLGGNVGRQGVSTYFRGDTLPRLPLLLRLERLTGWPLVVLATEILEFDQIPPAPLVDAPVIPGKLSTAEMEDLKGELHRMRLRLGRIIEQIEKTN